MGHDGAEEREGEGADAVFLGGGQAGNAERRAGVEEPGAEGRARRS
jgi:hypothetical protein